MTVPILLHYNEVQLVFFVRNAVCCNKKFYYSLCLYSMICGCVSTCLFVLAPGTFLFSSLMCHASRCICMKRPGIYCAGVVPGLLHSTNAIKLHRDRTLMEFWGSLERENHVGSMCQLVTLPHFEI